jgi:replicative DNA helicase
MTAPKFNGETRDPDGKRALIDADGRVIRELEPDDEWYLEQGWPVIQRPDGSRETLRANGTWAPTADLSKWVQRPNGSWTPISEWDPAELPPWEVAPERGPERDDDEEDPEWQVAAGKVYAAKGRRCSDGAKFVLDAPSEVPALWGNGDEVLAAKGEATLIVGPPGVGKTTLAQRLALAMVGVGPPSLLGYPVVREPKFQYGDWTRVLYVAADRPRQAQRSLVRMVSEADREKLRDGLDVWSGQLPFDIAREPKGLVALANEFGADVILLDSLKDVALDLVKDETGSRLNNAFQSLMDEGVDLIALHHQRKPQGGQAKPKSLADVYGSTWITAGVGSVILLWGDAGDPVVELSHLKQPAETVGPFQVLHEQKIGELTRLSSIDAYTLMRAAPNGIAAQEVAAAITAKPVPSRNDVEKARRQLERLVATGYAHRQDGAKGGVGGGVASRYYAVAAEDETRP